MVNEKFVRYAQRTLKKKLAEYGPKAVHDFNYYGPECVISQAQMCNAFYEVEAVSIVDAMDSLAELCHVIPDGLGVALAADILNESDRGDPIFQDPRAMVILAKKLPPRPVGASRTAVDATTEDCKKFLASHAEEMGIPLEGAWRRLLKTKEPEGWLRSFEHSNGTVVKLLEPFNQGAAGLRVDAVVAPGQAGPGAALQKRKKP